jgi:hypothetical protein
LCYSDIDMVGQLQAPVKGRSHRFWRERIIMTPSAGVCSNR